MTKSGRQFACPTPNTGGTRPHHPSLFTPMLVAVRLDPVSAGLARDLDLCLVSDGHVLHLIAAYRLWGSYVS